MAAPFGWLGLYHASGPNPDPMSLQHGNTSVSPGVQASIKSSSLSSTTECFTTLISSGDWRLTVSNTASARTHWLGTMLAMVLAVTSGVFRTLEFKVKSVRSVYLWQAEPSSAGLKRTWMDTKKLLENLQECFMQLQAIKEDQPLATIEDISSRTTAKLQRLIDRARSSEAEAKDRLGTQVSMKSIEMAEQSIQESKRVKLRKSISGPTRYLSLTLDSDHPCILLHSHQFGNLHFRNERARDQRDREANMDGGDYCCCADSHCSERMAHLELDCQG